MLAVITGGSSGIGAAFARQLAQRGWDLLLIARREDRLRAVARDLEANYRVAAEALPADLTDPQTLNALAARIRNEPDLRLLVNNAGFGVHGQFFESDPAAQQSMHLLHVNATMALTQAALANLVPQALRGTGVINVSSVAAYLPAATYGATKTWMNAFSETLANELAARGSPVKLQALCPGYTLTEFHDITGQDRSTVPSWLWMTPDYVVAESLRAFERGKLIVIPGWHYKVGVGIMQVFPATLRRRVSIVAADRYRKLKPQIENGSK